MESHRFYLSGFLVLGLALAGRAADPALIPSPFLGSASQLLVNGGKGQATLRYVNPNVNWNDFQNLIIDPVTYWVGEGENDGLTQQQRQDFVNYLNTQLRRQLSAQNWTLRDTPTAHTLRLSVALINSQHANISLAAIAGQAMTDTDLAAARTAESGQSVGGAVHGEMKLTNSVTGEIYGAAADQRRGVTTKSPKTIDAVSKAWVQQTVLKLCNLQNQIGCNMKFSDNAW